MRICYLTYAFSYLDVLTMYRIIIWCIDLNTFAFTWDDFFLYVYILTLFTVCVSCVHAYICMYIIIMCIAQYHIMHNINIYTVHTQTMHCYLPYCCVASLFWIFFPFLVPMLSNVFVIYIHIYLHVYIYI